MSIKVLITGASGFVGRRLCEEMARRGTHVKAIVRKPLKFEVAVEVVFVNSIDGMTDWGFALRDVDVVIHLAARVHVMHDFSANPLDEFRKINVDGTVHLARCAAKAGVKRFVYVSSIKVNGEATSERNKFVETDSPHPQDPYGVSKCEAELALHRIATENGLEVVVVRPPLVYGAGVKGNFISLFNAIDKGLPLPLAAAHNARSLVYVGNLVDALITCATHPNAAGKTYLVSDRVDVSTAMLVREIAVALNRPDRSFYFPLSVLRAVAGLLGKSAQVDRLFGSLQIDSIAIREELDWTPPYTLQQGLQATADRYRNTTVLR